MTAHPGDVTTLAPQLASAEPDSDDSLTHAVCACNDDVALCGADVAGLSWATEEEDVDCVVCLDLAPRPCARCGR
ncbi:hypothetical protein ACF1BS_04420 [Streptomyces sp. NPDC014748]|uniref:hypothetical protein n=1 Tax=Streptomyces sp. NPDC014748 TaxID=3364905 RepID=UPI0036F94579